MTKGNEGHERGKMMRFVSSGFCAIWILLILAACMDNGIQPVSTTLDGLESSIRPQNTKTVHELTPSKVLLSTSTLTPTAEETAAPSLYQIENWVEPAEVITPENMDKVRKIGTLVFDSPVVKMTWSPEGSKFGVSLLGPLYLLNPITFEHRLSLTGSFVVFSHDGRILETNGTQYDAETGEVIEGRERTVSANPGSNIDIEFSPNGDYVVAAGTAFILVYPMNANVEKGTFGRYVNEAVHASVSADGKVVAVNYSIDPFTELWDPYTRTPGLILKMKGTDSQGKPRFQDDGSSLFIAGSGAFEGNDATYFQEWDFLTGRLMHAVVVPGRSKDNGLAMDISRQSDVAAVGTWDGNIFLVEIHGCDVVQAGEIPESEAPVYIVSFRPDGKAFATLGIGDKSIEIWGIPAEQEGATPGPTLENSRTKTPCLDIPMIAEHPVPKYDWWGGGKPYE
jgi:WD40 repeat protein